MSDTSLNGTPPPEATAPNVSPASANTARPGAAAPDMAEASGAAKSSGHPWLKGLLLALLVLLLGAGGGAWWYAARFLDTPPQTPGQDVELAIAPGATLRGLARTLHERGVIRDADAFRLLARWRGVDSKVRAGRFLLSTGWTPDQVLRHLISGKMHTVRVTIPEGLPWWEVGKKLKEAGFVHAGEFAAVVRDPAFLRAWGIPFATAEGFLYPDTYQLVRPLELNPASAREVADALVAAFWRQSAALWPGRPGPEQAERVRRMVILASIVEKETSVPAERARVAGVYANRLKRGMLLQADPTIVYGLGPDFAGPLRRSHLDNARNAYNTYQRPGLPPGPICSPGLDSLRAAFAPEAHRFLYFVAAGSGGGHVFSATLAEHNRAVAAYRRAERVQKKK